MLIKLTIYIYRMNGTVFSIETRSETSQGHLPEPSLGQGAEAEMGPQAGVFFLGGKCWEIHQNPTVWC